MVDKKALIARIKELASVIGAPDSLLPAVDVPNDFAYPYVLMEDPVLQYVIRERGEILQNRQTSDLEELLYWIFQDVTFNMAAEFEKRHRVSGQDFRRVLWNHQMQLLEKLRPEWRKKRQHQIDRILEESPFSDLAT